jgi:hypothetical protein
MALLLRLKPEALQAVRASLIIESGSSFKAILGNYQPDIATLWFQMANSDDYKTLLL